MRNENILNLMSDKDCVQLIRDLPQMPVDSIAFTNEEVKALLGQNAARVLGISD